MWLNSPLKNNITLGQHKLNAETSNHLDIFKNSKSSKYDGVHYYGVVGMKLMTNSVLQIMKSTINPPHVERKHQNSNSDHTNCPQTLYQRRQLLKYHPSVQVHNRFSVFNSNLGNQ